MAAQTGFPLEFIVELEPEYPELERRIAVSWEKILGKLA